MINVTFQTNNNRPRTPQEVKRLLQDLAFILRTSQRIKSEIISKRKQTKRPASSAIEATVSPACAA